MGQLTKHAMPGVAEAHKPYVHGPGQIAQAAERLLGITPTVIASDRPLFRVTPREPRARLRIVPFQRPDTGRYLNVLDGTGIELAPELIAALRRKVEANRGHFPHEDTLASSFGVPGLYVRLDCFLTAGGVDPRTAWHPSQWNRVEIAVCELDD